METHGVDSLGKDSICDYSYFVHILHGRRKKSKYVKISKVYNGGGGGQKTKNVFFFFLQKQL